MKLIVQLVSTEILIEKTEFTVRQLQIVVNIYDLVKEKCNSDQSSPDSDMTGQCT